jgi:hypothetical protein
MSPDSPHCAWSPKYSCCLQRHFVSGFCACKCFTIVLVTISVMITALMTVIVPMTVIMTVIIIGICC